MNLLTKRIPTIVGIIMVLVAIFGLYYSAGQSKTTKSTQIAPEKIRITNIADNKFSVSWITKDSTSGVIEYGKVGEKITTKELDDRDADNKSSEYYTHHVTVDGLQPSTEYAFRILSSESQTRYDNNGSPYTLTTGPVVGEMPSSQNFYGKVEQSSKQSATGSIVYLTLPGGTTASSLVGDTGNYAITLSTIRATDLRSYIKYDPGATIASLTVESGTLESVVSVTLSNSTPVPTITLGQNAEFLTVPETPTIAEVSPELISEFAPETPSVFNVEPLAETADINVVGSSSVTILNPKESGETLATLRPEFRGTGTKGITLSIALTGQKAISDTLAVANDGTWSWAPVIDLKVGKQKITVSYIDNNGVNQKVEREFNISATKIGIDPAFVSSPSASTTTSSTSASTKPSSTPRALMPDTSEGTPVTGIIENTIATLAVGIIMILVGTVLVLF